MKSKKFIALLVMGIFMAAGAAFAQEAPKAEEVKPAMDLSGVAYIWWQKDMDNEAGNKNVNHFSINRVYLTWAKQFNDVWSVRLTTDVDGTAGSDSTTYDVYDTTGVPTTDTVTVKTAKAQNKVFFKNAYVQMKKSFDPVTVTVQYGLIGTPIAGLIDSKSDYRWIHNNYFDNSKALIGITLDPTADMGILASIDIMKMVTITGLYANGEGYTKGFNEEKSDKSKAYHGMLTVTPFQGLFLSGFYKLLDNANAPGTNVVDDSLSMYGGIIGWSDKTFKVGASYTMVNQEAGVADNEATLLDIWAHINLNQFVGAPVLAVGRYAQGTSSPDGGKDVDTTAWEAGLGYAFNKNVRVLALYEVVDTDGVDGKNETVWIKTEAKF